MILACDVGGTKTNLALVEPRGGRLEVAHLESFRSREHGSLDEIVCTFLGARPPRILAAGFGVAGPVMAGRATTTNLPWLVDGGRLAALLGLPSVSLLNDVEAHVWAVDRLAPEDLVLLQAGEARGGTVAVIAAGTGLGLAALVRGEGPPVSLASEGGHADFAPRDDVQEALARALRARHGQASVEQVVSGRGLVNVYEFLRDFGGEAEPGWLTTALREGDAAAAISRTAIAGRNPTCEAAVDLFLEAYGAAAGSWALQTLATGGVYLGGGIAAKLLGAESGAAEGWQARARATFMRGFLGTGRLRPLLEAIKVQVILDTEAPLIGAAHFAAQRAAWGRVGAAAKAERT